MEKEIYGEIEKGRARQRKGYRENVAEVRRPHASKDYAAAREDFRPRGLNDGGSSLKASPGR